jgi:hypothetical protein
MIRKICSVLPWLLFFSVVSCQPVIFARSDSPDGRYRCEVIKFRPLFSGLLGDGENWRYDFDLKLASTGERLRGGSFEYGDGKIKLDENKLQFKWTANQLIIVNSGYSPAREFLIASFDSTTQQWKQMN